MLPKLAIFDYCGTVVADQTADNFVLYVLETGSFPIRKKVASLVQRLPWPLKKFKKQLLLKCLIGLSRSRLDIIAEDYCIKVLRKMELSSVVKQIKHYQDLKFVILVLSAGYSIYIKKHCKYLEIDHVEANEFMYFYDFFTGFLLERDCYGEEKLRRLTKFEDKFQSSWDREVCFSDSMSDKPLFDVVNRGFFVVNDSYMLISHR